MPYKDKRTQKWIGQVTVNGQKITRRWDTKKEAKEWEIREAKTVLVASSTPTVSLGEWAVAYLDFAKQKFVVKTYQEKRAVFREFFAVVDKDMRADEFTAGIGLSFLQGEIKAGRSGYAVNKARKNLGAAWEYGIRYVPDFPQRHEKPNPFHAIPKFSETRSTRYVPSEDDFWAVYHAADTEQDKTMLLAYLHTAARRSELFRLRWSDVDFFKREIRLTSRKNRDGSWKEHWLPMTDDLHAAMISHHKKTASSQWVFPDPQTGDRYEHRLHVMRRLCDRAGVKQFGFHAIRHLTASILARENVPMVDIQSILRHNNLSTTERYIRRLRNNRSAVAKLPSISSARKNKKPASEPAEQNRQAGQTS